MRRLLVPVFLAVGAAAFACATGNAVDDDVLPGTDDASAQIDVGTPPPPPPPPGDSGSRDTGSSTDARRDVGSLPDAIPPDSALADVVFNPDATGGPADCPTANQTDFLFYYLLAITELSGPNPENCPCANTALRCCFAGLVCVDRN
jgi:hypothetical protein